MISTIRPICIENELRHSYLNYALSVILSRALPVRDVYFPKSFFQDIKSLGFYSINSSFSNTYNFLYQVSVMVQTSALMWARLSHFNSRL